jgi:hypothetical protein
VETQLNPNVLKVVIAPDGMSVHLKVKKTECEDPTTLLRRFRWGNNVDHFVVKTLGDELNHYNMNKNAEDEWTTEVILETHEEIVREFVNVDGEMNDNKVKYSQDDDNRQYIAFFVQTMTKAKAAPRAGVFDNTETPGLTRRGYNHSTLAAAAAAAAATTAAATTANNNMVVDTTDTDNELRALNARVNSLADTFQAVITDRLKEQFDNLHVAVISNLTEKQRQERLSIVQEVTQAIMMQHQQQAAVLDAQAQQQVFMTPEPSPDSAPSSGRPFPS